MHSSQITSNLYWLYFKFGSFLPNPLCIISSNISSAMGICAKIIWISGPECLLHKLLQLSLDVVPPFVDGSVHSFTIISYPPILPLPWPTFHQWGFHVPSVLACPSPNYSSCIHQPVFVGNEHNFLEKLRFGCIIDQIVQGCLSFCFSRFGSAHHVMSSFCCFLHVLVLGQAASWAPEWFLSMLNPVPPLPYQVSLLHHRTVCRLPFSLVELPFLGFTTVLLAKFLVWRAMLDGWLASHCLSWYWNNNSGRKLSGSDSLSMDK